MKQEKRNKAVVVSEPECDGEGVWFSFSLSDEEGSISGNPQQVILCLTSAQVTVEPPAQHTQGKLHYQFVCVHVCEDC